MCIGFTVTHEMTIAVKSVENIGHLVDKILTKSGITLQSFEWKANQVNIFINFRNLKHMKMLLLKVWKKDKVFVSNLE